VSSAFAELRDAGMPVSRACALTGRARATHYRHAAGPVHGPRLPRAVPGNGQALSAAERAEVLTLISAPAYADLSIGQIWARELDAGSYLCSASSMYRIAAAAGQSRERRRQAAHPAKVKPELLADGPSQVWTWDITKLRGPARGVFYQLYVLIDIYSRFNPSWIISPAGDSLLATDFIAEAIARNGTAPHTVHADRGTSMTSKPVSALLADLGVTRSHSRPRVSNDNPYSEAQLPGSGQGSHLPAPTDPDVNLSAHPARAVQSFGQYRSAQCANSRGASFRTSFSHLRARLSLRSSRLYFRLAQRIRWRSMRSQSGITLLG
jgi:putative transposase